MREKIFRNRIALRGGSYSLIVTAVVLAILTAVNVLASVLPKTLTQYDISSTKLYSVTSNTKVVLNALDKEVTIYWIVQADEENDVIESLLGKYESMSEYIKVVKKNPDVFPTFASSILRKRCRITVWSWSAESAAVLSATTIFIFMRPI